MGKGIHTKAMEGWEGLQSLSCFAFPEAQSSTASCSSKTEETLKDASFPDSIQSQCSSGESLTPETSVF